MSPINQTGKIKKGAPSGLIVSLIFHAAAFFIAGLFVVFTVLPDKQPEFTAPPPLERPKMKLKKPKVKIKKSSQPKPSSRIVAKVKNAKMPEIQIPDLVGTGDGILGVLGAAGDFMDIPPIEEITLFGSGQSTGNDFVGTLYDLKRKRDGAPTGFFTHYEILYAISRFSAEEWDLSELNRYHKSPKKLYTKHFTFPDMLSSVAPTAFGEPDMPGYAWVAYYRGKIVYPTGGRFRFWGGADDVLIVRINGEIVFDGSIMTNRGDPILSDFHNPARGSLRYHMADGGNQIGKWFDLMPGEPLDMEVLIGEVPGGGFSCILAVEQEGVEYEGPLLPIFKTEKLTHAELDAIYEYMRPGYVCLTNGPVFNDYARLTTNIKSVESPVSLEEEVIENPEDPLMRKWTSADGKSSVYGKYVSRFIGESVFVETTEGKNIKLQWSELSSDDREYLELVAPPSFSMDIMKSSKTRILKTRRPGRYEIPNTLQWQFGARVKQIGREPYNHELTVEYYTIGQQIIDRNKYFLMDRERSRFTPSENNEYMHEFHGKRINEVMAYTFGGESMGRKYYGYIIVIRGVRGNIIAHRTSSKWLWENFEKLEKLPLGAFFDNTCTRVHPTGLPSKY